MVSVRTQRRRPNPRWLDRDGNLSFRPLLRGLRSSKLVFRIALISLAVIAILPPVFFHFKLRRFRQMQLKTCSWVNNPPLVCAHGGDSSTAFPNTTVDKYRGEECDRLARFTRLKHQGLWIMIVEYPVTADSQMAAYQIALHSQVDCIEIDVSRSSDGVLFALHDRDLQRITGNNTSRVGYLSKDEIKNLDATHRFSLDSHDNKIPTIEDALKLVSGSVRKVILDAKVGPPSYEKGLAKDIISVVERAGCKNCLIWAKSDSLARDVMKQSSDVTVGYIVMMDPSTGASTNLLRMRDAGVVGIYHPLINEKVVKVLHGRKKKVYAWTVDDKASMQRMLYENVDAVVTSIPTLLQGLMQDVRTTCLEEGFSLSS